MIGLRALGLRVRLTYPTRLRYHRPRRLSIGPSGRGPRRLEGCVSSEPPAKFFVNSGLVSNPVDIYHLLRPLL